MLFIDISPNLHNIVYYCAMCMNPLNFQILYLLISPQVKSGSRKIYLRQAFFRLAVMPAEKHGSTTHPVWIAIIP